MLRYPLRVRADPTACLLVEELLSPGHGARGQRRTGRAEPLSFRDPLERRPQAAPAHASLQGHRSAWHWRLGLGLGLGLVVAAARHMCQPASQESHSSISCALSSRPHLTQWSSASSSELPPLIPASRDLQLLAGEGQNADKTARQQAHEMRAPRIARPPHTRHVSPRFRHAEVPLPLSSRGGTTCASFPSHHLSHTASA